MNQFSHVDRDNNPAMVDVGSKSPTRRSATARAIVRLPTEVINLLQGDDINTKKGPVFQTAMLAGIMGAKKTSELIPLCHPLAIEDCKIDVKVTDDHRITVQCTARISGKTGVEMEALAGATIAALTIYDMCKSFSHDIVIEEVKLWEKTGGKQDFKRS